MSTSQVDTEPPARRRTVVPQPIAEVYLDSVGHHSASVCRYPGCKSRTRSPPYHISRRGWGEFPVKLRIHFKNEKLNKPVNLEHLLKLDRNYSGLQELGGETVVDVWLYADDTMLGNKMAKPPDDKETKTTSHRAHQALKEGHTLLNSEFFPLYSSNIKNKSTIEASNPENNIQDITTDHQSSLLSDIDIKTEQAVDDIMEINETRMECDVGYREVLNNIKKEKEDNIQDNCHLNYNGFIGKIKEEPIDESDVMDCFYNHSSNNDNTVFNRVEDINVFNNRVLPLQNNLIHPKKEAAVIISQRSDTKSIKKQVSLLKSNNSRSLLNPAVIEKLSPNKSRNLISRSILKYNSDKEKITKNLLVLNSMLNDHCYVNEKYLIHNVSEIKENQQKQSNENVALKIESSVRTNVLCNDKIDHLKSFNLIYANKGILLDGATLLNNFPKPSQKIILGINSDSSYRIGLSKADRLASQKVVDIVSFFRDYLERCSDTRCAVSLMLKNMPMVEESASSADFLKVFPYTVQNTDAYFALDCTKRRNLEWTRAKTIQNYLKLAYANNPTQSNIEIWTTKQIILFSHCHGYFPIKSTRTDNENVNFDESNNLYLYGYDGEKTFQEKIDLKEQFASASHINTKTKTDVFTTNEVKTERIPVINIKKEFSDDIDNHEYITNSKVGINAPNLSVIKRESIYEEISSSDRDRAVVYELDDSSDEEIDICDVSDGNNQLMPGSHLSHHDISRKMAACEVLPFESDDEKLRCFFIEKKCAELGIELRNEHVGNGFSHSLVHKTILAAVKCLVEDIARRSLAVKMAAMDTKMDVTIDNIGQSVRCSPKLWDKTETGAVHTVSLRHVYEAILGRKELDLLTNSGLGSEIVKYHGNL